MIRFWLVYIVYQSLYILLFPLVLGLLFLRKDTRKRISHFLGVFREESGDGHPQQSGADWFHAVSFGETKIAVEFIKAGLKLNKISQQIVFTTTIENALEYFREQQQTYFPELKAAVYFLPLDFHPIIKAFVKRIRPARFFVSETDFWPGLLLNLGHSKTNCYLINGRLSNHLSWLYSCFYTFSNVVFSNFEHLYLQYTIDQQRARQFCSAMTTVIGNAKFDLLIDNQNEDLPSKIPNHKNILFGSFHKDEFQIILQLKELLNHKHLFIIAPRKLETIPYLLKLLNSHNLSALLFSQCDSQKIDCNCLIIDCMGLLNQLYKHCDLAIIGGSFNKIGGHNFLEPMLHKRPVLIGPNTRNLSHDAEQMSKLGYLHQKTNVAELADLINNYYLNPKVYINNSIKAYQYIIDKRGILEKTWKLID